MLFHSCEIGISKEERVQLPPRAMTGSKSIREPVKYVMCSKISDILK